MAFITSGGNVIAFAEYSDVTDTDQRLFEANEGISDETMVEDLTIKATARILQLVRTTSWWRSYYMLEATTEQNQATQTKSYPDVPLPNANYILGRRADWTDLCVYYTLYEYLLPKVADFSAQDNAEVQKIGVYRTKFDKLFMELIQDGTWYDFDGSGVVTAAEKFPQPRNLVRVR